MNEVELIAFLRDLSPEYIQNVAELLGPCQASLDLHQSLTTVANMPDDC